MIKIQWSETQALEIIEHYKNGLSSRQISKKYNVSNTTILSLLKFYNVRMRSSKKYSLNDNYFDTIDTEEKAYFLGLLYADGCNLKEKNQIKIGLQERDKKILDKFKISLYYTGPLHFYRRDNKGIQNEWILHIYSKRLSAQLNNLGCTPRKSLTLEFPTEEQVPSHLIRHFIRGYFDGDGCLSIFSKKDRPSKSACCAIISTEKFCTSMKLIIDKETNINSHVNTKGTNGITKALAIGGNQQVLLFLEWLYQDATIYLERKYDKYQEFLELRKSTGSYNKKKNHVKEF